MYSVRTGLEFPASTVALSFALIYFSPYGLGYSQQKLRLNYNWGLEKLQQSTITHLVNVYHR